MADIYEPLDLEVFDPELKGRTLKILRNPTRRFRMDFMGATGDKFPPFVARTLGVEADAIDGLLADYDAALYIWLFIGALGDDGKWILPHVYKLWDAYAAERIKKLSAAPTPSAKAMTVAPG